jgi:hypothetical protein
MTEPHNAGLWYAYPYITLDRHQPMGIGLGPSGALSRGNSGEAHGICEPEPITRPRLYQIAHNVRFFEAAKTGFTGFHRLQRRLFDRAPGNAARVIQKSFSTGTGTETTLGYPHAVEVRIVRDMNCMVVVSRLSTTATTRPVQSNTGAPEEP